LAILAADGGEICIYHSKAGMVERIGKELWTRVLTMRWYPTAVCIKKYFVTKLLAGRSNPGRVKILFAFPNVQVGSEAHPSTCSVDSFPWAKWIEREVDHSAPSSAVHKHEWSYTSAPPDVFMTWVETTLCCPLFEFTEELHTVI
jgi:hypothetical protein